LEIVYLAKSRGRRGDFARKWPDLLPDRILSLRIGRGTPLGFGEAFCASQFTVFNDGVQFAVVAFHFPLVHPRVLLPCFQEV